MSVYICVCVCERENVSSGGRLQSPMLNVNSFVSRWQTVKGRESSITTAYIYEITVSAVNSHCNSGVPECHYFNLCVALSNLSRQM